MNRDMLTRAVKSRFNEKVALMAMETIDRVFSE
jgi:hypothetical protein